MAVIELEVVSGRSEVQCAEARPLPIELFAAAVAFLLPVAYATGLEAEVWSARVVILLIVSALGLPCLLTQIRRPHALAARSAVAFLLIGSASAILSANHTTAIFGLYSEGTGLLFMGSLAAAWTIGRSIRPRARELVERALILGVLVNVGIAILGSVVDLSSLIAGLAKPGGRSAALAGNPVHLASLVVLGLALMVPRFASAPAAWAIPIGATAAAAQISGTRVALVVVAGILVWAGRRHGVRLAAGFALIVVLGLAAGGAIGSASATGRASDLQDSWSVRPQTWLSARHALAQRPLLGIGPGQFRTATSPYRPISVGRLEGPETLFTDAHNLFVEYATTTGLLGVAALTLWLLAATRQGRGCLLVGAVAMLAIDLFEPQSVVSTPLAFLALGSSASLGTGWTRSELGYLRWIGRAGCLFVAVTVSAMFLVGEFDLRQAQLDLRVDPASAANQILPAWPRTASLLARVWLFEGIVGRNEVDMRQGRMWQLAALKRDNTDPGLWNNLAELDESRGLTKDAQIEYLQAVHFNPTSTRAMNGLARLARGLCDAGQERYWEQRSLRVAPPLKSSAAGKIAVKPLPPVCPEN